ncbi:hypothetical protein [Nostocoides vanveenii]|uniref:arsenate reductase/protein-tyrosine-phosphatase family protein n=1 Tax=Nostocoides vanveenii TaxID=330835 RepID=UPI0031D59C6D
MSGPQGPLRILVVCTGNVCRSAFAHHYLAAHLDSAAFAVASAGVGWHSDLVVPPENHAIGARYGISLDTHQGRFAASAVARETDLILTATKDHRRALLEETPAALKRCFTILEFTALLDASGRRPGPDPAAWRELIRDLATRRETVQARDLPDPYGLAFTAYEEMARLLVPALDVIVAAARPQAAG